MDPWKKPSYCVEGSPWIETKLKLEWLWDKCWLAQFVQTSVGSRASVKKPSIQNVNCVDIGMVGTYQVPNIPLKIIILLSLHFCDTAKIEMEEKGWGCSGYWHDSDWVKAKACKDVSINFNGLLMEVIIKCLLMEAAGKVLTMKQMQRCHLSRESDLLHRTQALIWIKRFQWKRICHLTQAFMNM